MLAVHLLLLLPQGPPPPQEADSAQAGPIYVNHGVFVDPPGPLSVELHGRLYLEALRPTGDLGGGQEPEREQDLRSARIQASFEAGPLSGRGQWEFAGGEVDFKELFVQGDPLSGLRLRAGQQREPAGLEALQSSAYNPFPERAAPTQAFTPGRNLGLVASHRSGPWSAWIGAFRESEETTLSPEGDGRSVTARGTWLDGGDEAGESLLHLGLWISQREEGLRYRARPGSSLLPRLIDTGSLGEADALSIGAELAWQRDGWTLSSEYQLSEVNAAEDQSLSGVSVQASWRPAGEARSYSRGKGAFGGFTPKDPRGSLEFAARAAHTDLDSSGSQNDLAVGVNIQLTKRSRWMLHLQQSRANGAEVQGILLRLQIGF